MKAARMKEISKGNDLQRRLSTAEGGVRQKSELCRGISIVRISGIKFGWPYVA